jgi:hypothetical protein
MIGYTLGAVGSLDDGKAGALTLETADGHFHAKP